MRGRVALFLLPVAGCVAYQPCHRSHLIELHHAGSDRETRHLLLRQVALFEDAIVGMVDDFQVPLHQVIPVKVYHAGAEADGRSYYNRLTRSIVLRGQTDLTTFVHELSHLLAHQVNSSPTYWSDQALAEYMEIRFTGGRRPDRALAAMHGDKEHYLLCSMARASEPSEVLAHLSRDAVDEDRGWGLMVVRYLFEDRWRDRPLGEKIRLLLRLKDDDVAEMAPGVLEYCRRRELVGGTSAAGG